MGIPRRAFVIGAVSAALLPCLPAAASPGTVAVEGPAFGASWRAVVARNTDSTAVTSLVQAVVAEVDVAMSPFRPDSEIARFNASDRTGWFAMSPATCLVVAEALRIARLTGGAFDPTVGGIVGRYGFGPITRRSAGDHTGVAVAEGAVRKDREDLTLDPCGIAKGHALDRMTRALEAAGSGDFLIEVGGEVAARGRHPAGRPWQVAIERPVPGATGPQRILALAGEALATSGDGVNAYQARGRRYGHIVDPRRRRPASTALASVSVLAPTAMEADALATALYAMGTVDGPDFARARGIAALFLLREAADLREIMTGAFAKRLVA